MAKSGPKGIFLIKIGAGGAKIFWFFEKLEGGGPSESFRGGGCRPQQGWRPPMDKCAMYRYQYHVCVLCSSAAASHCSYTALY